MLLGSLLFVAIGATFAAPLLDSPSNSVSPAFDTPESQPNSPLADNPPHSPGQSTPTLTPNPSANNSPAFTSVKEPDLLTSVGTTIDSISTQPTSLPSTFPSTSLSSLVPSSTEAMTVPTHIPPPSSPPSPSYHSTSTSDTAAASSTATTTHSVSSSSGSSTTPVESRDNSPKFTPSRTGLPGLPIPTTGQTEIDQYLSVHNSIRAAHDTPLLTWSEDLAAKAADWAGQCQFKHTDGQYGPFGENLVAATGQFTAGSAAQTFVNESYDPERPTFNHLTQVLWKSTSQVGCGVALCNNMLLGRKLPTTYHVCMYDPVGNVIGQSTENVLALQPPI